jgi:predicted regulator of amino acid metabolism with ACT domain
LPAYFIIDLKRTVFQLLEFFKYWLLKEDQYSIQSPFVYQRYCGLLKFLTHQDNKALKANPRQVFVWDGKQELVLSQTIEKKNLAKELGQKRTTLKERQQQSNKLDQIFQYFCNLTPSETIIEIHNHPKKHAEKVSLAIEKSRSKNQKSILEKNIKSSHETPLSTKNIFFDQETFLDFVLIDMITDHKFIIELLELVMTRLKKTSIVIIHHIHYSPEMKKAWVEIITQNQVKLSLDFFDFGVLFFDSPSSQKNYILSI